jgi:citrate lyase alpha subunit
VDAVLSYCHDNLADDTLQGLLPYLREKGVKVISASFSSMGLLTQKVSIRTVGSRVNAIHVSGMKFCAALTATRPIL